MTLVVEKDPFNSPKYSIGFQFGVPTQGLIHCRRFRHVRPVHNCSLSSGIDMVLVYIRGSRHCPVDELLQFSDSHAIVSAPALCPKILSARDCYFGQHSGSATMAPNGHDEQNAQVYRLQWDSSCWGITAVDSTTCLITPRLLGVPPARRRNSGSALPSPSPLPSPPTAASFRTAHPAQR